MKLLFLVGTGGTMNREDKIFFADMFLSKSFSHQVEIDAIRTKIEMLEQEINRVVADYDKKEISSSRSGNTQERLLAILIDEKAELKKRIKEQAELNRKTFKLISRINDSFDRAILINRYCNRKSWFSISKLLHSSEATIFRHREKALLEIYDIIKEEKEVEE